MLIINIVFSLSLTSAKSRSQLFFADTLPKNNNSSNSISYLLAYELTYGIDEFLDNFANFKPVLRMIFQCIMYIFLIDYLLVHPFSLVHGGRLVQAIASIPSIRSIDTGKWFHFRRILLFTGLHLVQSFIGFIIFSNYYLVQFYKWTFTPGYTLPVGEEFITKRSIFIILSYPIFYIFESMITFLFIYVMIVFKSAVRMIADKEAKEGEGIVEKERGEEGGAMTVARLQLIREQLVELSEHFKKIISQLTFPLTTLHLVNVYLIICSLCYLVVPSSKYRFYAGIVFNFGAFALTRMVIVCYAGGLVTKEMKALKDRLKLQLNSLDLSLNSKETKLFKEIKRLKKKFTVTTIWGSLRVDQTAIWKILGFSLSYVVMLLQTEDYEKFDSDKSASSCNCSTE